MGVAKRGLSIVEKVAFGLLLVVVVLIFSRSGGSTGDLIAPGTPLPELMAEGWLNVGESPGANADGSPEIPTRENLAGKVVVVDFWSITCPPCMAGMPRLAKIRQQYRSHGVEFVGLTFDPESDRTALERFIHSVEGFDWPVAYGAVPTFDMLGVYVTPTIVVFSKSGRATWSSSSSSGLEAALDEALAR